MMRFRDWKLWLQSLPWSLRWFPILVILRPVIDQFWHLKHISPLLSPLYWTGILTPIFCLIGIKAFSQPQGTRVSKIFRIWTILALSNGVLVLILNFNLNYIILFLKLTMPIYLFYFLRVFILSTYDLKGILTACLYACYIVVGLFAYELIFGARTIEITRHTLERWEGGFADVLNYALYAVSGFLLVVYLYLDKSFQIHKDRLLFPVIALIISTLILSKIYHTTSFIAMILLIALALFRIFKHRPAVGIVFIVIVLVGYKLFGIQLKEKAFDPLVDRELEVYSEGRDNYRQFNGRMGRWMIRVALFKKGNVVGKIFGSGIGLFGTEALVGAAVHNDILRMTFYTGFIGVVFYLLFYIQMLFRRNKMGYSERFLVDACILMILVYSITTIPTMYAPFMYFLMSVFAYASLPVNQLQENAEEPGN